MTEFREFPKIARFSRMATVTEKIDGTNACIYIGDDGEFLTGSRNRWITPEDDNFGFSRWAHEHKEELMTLGAGQHFGEWWGHGIQRGYGLPKGDRRFSLFNVSRWALHNEPPRMIPSSDPRVVKMQDVLPACVGLVPVLWRGNFKDLHIRDVLVSLVLHGSRAVAKYEKPEGVVVYHEASRMLLKMTIERDDEPKSKR